MRKAPELTEDKTGEKCAGTDTDRAGKRPIFLLPIAINC